MKKIFITLFLMVAFYANASFVQDHDRIWREHIITDVATQKTMSLVGYFPHPDVENQMLPYMLHIAAMQKHNAFYMNLSSMVDNFHPKTPVMVQIGDDVRYFKSQNSNNNGVAESIRVSDTTMTVKMFTFDELNTCTGEYKKLVDSKKYLVNYVNTSGNVRELTVYTAGLVKTMQRVYGIPDSCKTETSVVAPVRIEQDQANKMTFDWFGAIVSSLMVCWSIMVSMFAKDVGRSQIRWFLFAFFLTPMVAHITLYFLNKKVTKAKKV